MARIEPQRLNRRLVLGGLVALPGAAAAQQGDGEFFLRGHACQGGTLIGRTRPAAEVRLDGEVVTRASGSGFFVIGFDRDAPGKARLEIGSQARELMIAPVSYSVQHVSGLPQDTVTPSDPALLERIRREAALKAEAFASRLDIDDFRDGFAWPLRHFVTTGAFGNQRVLNGVPSRPHYGADLAAPKGTPILAPASGVVVLSQPELHYDGGLTLIDHGQGLVSAYLHQSRQDIAKGARVARGQIIGAVGSTGRATGPHLCWRLSWRGRHLDPTLLTGLRKPA